MYRADLSYHSRKQFFRLLLQELPMPSNQQIQPPKHEEKVQRLAMEAFITLTKRNNAEI